MNEKIQKLEVSAFKVPTDFPESDGTLEWDSTTIIVVEVTAADTTGIGYSYTSSAAVTLIREKLSALVRGKDALAVRKIWEDLCAAVRNMGRPGIAAAAISAIDGALWDLKARLLRVPLVKLLGQVRERIPAYGSGGFTSYPVEKLYDQLHGWAEDGFRMMKIKIGRDAKRDGERIRAAREAIGEKPQLFVDANGAYSRKQALCKAEEFLEADVTWFEEPVSSDDFEGLRLLRDRAPARVMIAAGEYGYDATYFRRMLETGAVDVLQADATRCGGITGFLQAATLCDAFHVPLSAHTAPSLHANICCALPSARHVEYFHDHVRIEKMFFDGVPKLEGGCLRPDLSKPGIGLDFKRAEATRFLIS